MNMQLHRLAQKNSWCWQSMLAEELQDVGIAKADVDPLGVVYATLAANDQGHPSIGFDAHMDTATDLSGADVQPRMIPAI